VWANDRNLSIYTIYIFLYALQIHQDYQESSGTNITIMCNGTRKEITAYNKRKEPGAIILDGCTRMEATAINAKELKTRERMRRREKAIGMRVGGSVQIT